MIKTDLKIENLNLAPLSSNVLIPFSPYHKQIGQFSSAETFVWFNFVDRFTVGFQKIF